MPAQSLHQLSHASHVHVLLEHVPWRRFHSLHSVDNTDQGICWHRQISTDMVSSRRVTMVVKKLEQDEEEIMCLTNR